MNKILRLSLIALLAVFCGGGAFAQDATIDFDNDYATLFPTLPGVSSGSGATAVTDGDFTVATTSTAVNGVTVTVSTSTSSTANRIWSGSPRLRMYGGTLTVNSAKDIAKIVFTTKTGKSRKFDMTANSGSLTDNDWTGNAKEIVFTCKSNTQIMKMDITFATAGSVAPPVINGEETFKGSTSITLNAEDGADIYYTTDETDPTTASTKYTGAFTISNTTTVKAIAAKGGKSSTVTSKTFTKIQEMTIAEAQAATTGTVCGIKGTVVATCTRGCLIGDETGYIYYFANAAHEYVIGDKIDISGAVSLYNGFNQFTNTATITKIGTEEVTHPTAQSMTGADVTAWAAAPEIKYVTITGALNISGNYYNVTIDGTEIVGSIVSPDEALKAQLTTGKSYAITGYAIYVNGSTTKYMNILPISVADPTGINGITTDTANENAPIYNLAGQRVNKNAKGILIQNGKKFVNK